MILDPLSLLTAIASLAAVIALIWFAQRMVRGAGLAGRGPAQTRRLVLREALALDTRRRLHLVSCDGRDVLLLTGGATDVVVGWARGPGGEP